MKLHQQIQEMTGPVPHELILAKIIQDGDVTDHYQVLVLSILSGFFKAGPQSANGSLSGILPLSSDATQVSVIEAIKSLSPSDKVNLASYLLSCLTVGSSALHNAQMSSSDWIRFVLQKNNN